MERNSRDGHGKGAILRSTASSHTRKSTLQGYGVRVDPLSVQVTTPAPALGTMAVPQQLAGVTQTLIVISLRLAGMSGNFSGLGLSVGRPLDVLVYEFP